MNLLRLINDNPKELIDTSVKKVFIRRNRWDNYGAFIGNKKVRDGANKQDLIDTVRELHPNAEIIDKTNY